MHAAEDAEIGSELEAQLELALTGVEFTKWGYFWPFMIALWRFLRKQRPIYFDDLDTSFDKEPTFFGRPAKWFCEQLMNDEEILDGVDTFMRRTIGALALVPQTKERGFALRTDLPAFDTALCSRIALRSLALTDQAVRQGILAQK